MKRIAWLALCLALAACAPAQVGVEMDTSTPGVMEGATATTTVAAEASSTPTAPRRTVVTVTPSIAALTKTPSPLPPSATATSIAGQPPAATATRRPAASSTATSAPPVGTPMVNSFQADRIEADPGDPITLSWTTSEAATVSLSTGALDGSGGLAWRTLAAGLPASGSLTVTIDDVAPAQLFRLEAVGDPTVPGSSNQVSVRRRHCPLTFDFVFPADRFNCAAGPPVTVGMVEQVFEHGRLLLVDDNLWINPRDEPAIFVLNEFGMWVSRTNTWHVGEPESDPALVPPHGRYQPVGSFGKLWRDELRDQFGWALAPEQRYAGSYQNGWSPQPGWETGAPGWYAWDLYLRLVGGGVVRLVWGSRFIGPTWELLPQ